MSHRFQLGIASFSFLFSQNELSYKLSNDYCMVSIFGMRFAPFVILSGKPVSS
jgi:hypothetical protein